MMGRGIRVLVGTWLFASLAFPIGIAAEPLPQSVLIFNDSGPGIQGYADSSASLRSNLKAKSSQPLIIYTENLDLNQFRGLQYEKTLSNYIREKYLNIPIGVIVANGTESLKFALQLRTDQRWTSGPIVFATVDEDRARSLMPAPNVTGKFLQFSLSSTMAAARALVPDINQVVFVGDPLKVQPFRSHFVADMSKATADVTVNDLTGLPIGEVKKRVAMLPHSAVIVYTTWTTDVAGNQYLPNEALEIIADAANRPIVIDVDNRLGHGGTGGFVVVSTLIGEEAANLVLRLFNGEDASQIPITSSDALKPIFDWRQLKRWGVNESNLPPGSEIRFRQFTAWEQYRWQIVTIAIVIIFQSALITWLIIEHRRRRVAEIEGHRSLMQVTQLDLALTASAMSASMAHELNQPLSAIMSNTEAAEMLLAANVPDIKQVQEILADIHRDDQRATEIIRHLRKLLKHDDQEVQDVDLNELIADTVDMLEPEASGRGVVLAFDPGPHKIVCRADPVRLQQVILNLALNGMDAMQDCAGERKLTFLISSADESEVMVSAADTGVGIPEDKLQSIFEPLVTMKQQGSGLGLFIARTIINAYGGRIWAENRIGGGAIFHFTLVRALALTA